jgi:hypothetical protein
MNDLTKPTELNAFGQQIAALIRAEQHDEADQVLREASSHYSSPATVIATMINASDIRVTGWSAFNERIEFLSVKLGKPISAAWLHISNYTDDAADGLRHPVIELGYLHDGRVLFSGETLESLLEMCVAYPAPWTGSPDADGQELDISGLGQLNDWLIKREWGAAVIGTPTIRIADAIAEWFLKLCFHRAIHRELHEQGLVRDIPLIVGSHDVGPWCQAIYRRSKSFTLDAKKRPDRLLAEQEEADERLRRERTEVWIAEVTKFRDHLRNRYAHPSQVEYAAARIAELFKFSLPIPLRRMPWDMKDAEFADLLHRIRYFRDPKSTPPPLSSEPPPGLARRINSFGFGRKRN